MMNDSKAQLYYCWTFGHSVNDIQRTHRREIPHKLPAKFLKSSCVARTQQSTAIGPQKGSGSIALRLFPSTNQSASFPIRLRCCENLKGPAEGAHYRCSKAPVNELSQINFQLAKYLSEFTFFRPISG
jgi:hypothetical protein